jgi:translocation and assembly module TamB
MSEPISNPPENIESSPQAAKSKPASKFLRHLLRMVFVFAFLAAGGIAAFYLWISSTAFEEMARKQLILIVGNSTGGRVELKSFRWQPLNLEMDVNGLTIHGKEAANETPYLQVAHLQARISILGFLSPKILLRNLQIDQPSMHLIVYPDGTTNQPKPKPTRKAGKSSLDRLFDLKTGHLGITQGAIDFESRAAAFDFWHRFLPITLDAQDFSVLMSYVPALGGQPESYRIESGARDLHFVRESTAVSPVAQPTAEKLAPVEGFMQATVDLTRNAAFLRTLRITASGKGVKDRSLEITGDLQDFSSPRWQGNVTGELDLRLLESLTGYNFAPQGLAHLNLSGAGVRGVFRIDGGVHIEDGSYIGTGVVATGVRLDAHVHADPERLQVTSIVARLRQGGQLEGDLELAHWLPPVPGMATLQQSTPSGKQKVAHNLPAPPADPFKPSDIIEIPVDGKVTARFEGVALDTLLEMVALPPFQHLGFDTRINGPAVATWIKGDVRTLDVNSQLLLAAPAQIATNQIALNGAIDGIYHQRDGSVDLHRMDLHLPASDIHAQGRLGAYPMTGPTGMAVDLRLGNLGEFDTALRDLGLSRNGKIGTAALPIALKGQAEFHGNWAGSLSDPRLAGTVKATLLDLEVPVSSEKNSKTETVHWDSVEAAGSYSSARIEVENGRLRNGQAEIDLDGSLAAEPCAKPSCPAAVFDPGAKLHARVKAAGVHMEQLQPLLAQNLPITGSLSTQLAVDGPLRSLAGTGWAELDKGSIWNEPINSIRAQGTFTVRTVNLADLTIATDAGRIIANGSYNLQSRSFQLDAHGTAIDIARIQHFREQGVDATGKLQFNLAGSGTLDDPHVQAKATLVALQVGGQALGSLDLQVHTADRKLNYQMSTRFEGAELALHGQTSLNADYSTQARLDFSQFNIGALLAMAHVQGLSGESSLAGSVSVDGPLSRPEELRGEARLQQAEMTLSGVHLHSEGDLHATLSNARLNLDPLHILGEDTNLHLQGALSLKGSRQLDLAAAGTFNLKVLETFDPDITAGGSSTFQVEAHGPLLDPGLRGRVDFQNGALALQDLPNSLSQLRGSLEFNQNRLEVKSLTAMTGGGVLSLGGYLTWQHGLFADLTATGKGVRIRYPEGVSSLADATLHLQGPQNNLQLSGDVMITRFSVSSDFDIAALVAQTNSVQTIAPLDAPSNHVRLDVFVRSSPQLNFQNAYAKLAGDVDLRVRGTVASPSLLGRISIIEGSAIFAGTRYELQRGEVSFNNPVRIQPLIDLNATARVEDYDITLGLHGTLDKPAFTYRSDPPLPEADVVALLALGRTQNQQRLYTQQQMQTVASPTTDALLGGALNAAVSSRVQKLFGAGSVKVDPNYLGALGNSTSRIIVEEQFGRNVTLTYATNVNTTGQQLIQAEVAINRHVSLVVARDESGVSSVVLKATRRYK